jgi:hypothetical protein
MKIAKEVWSSMRWALFIMVFLVSQADYVRRGVDMSGQLLVGATEGHSSWMWCLSTLVLAVYAGLCVLGVVIVVKIAVFISTWICRLAGREVVDPKNK